MLHLAGLWPLSLSHSALRTMCSHKGLVMGKNLKDVSSSGVKLRKKTGVLEAICEWEG